MATIKDGRRVGKTKRSTSKKRTDTKHAPKISTREEVTYAAGAFDVDNAKQLTVEKTVRYFVPSPAFVGLFSSKNDILLGSRGSGKTTWVRMLAHDHVVLAAKQQDPAYQYARDALSKNVIGIYVPTNIGLVGSLKNKPWQNEEAAEMFFQWRLNLHSCAALIPIIRSCIDHYVPDEVNRAIVEATISRQLSSTWSRGKSIVTTLNSLRLLTANIEAERIDNISRYRAQGKSIHELNDYFDSELFQPIRLGINVLTHHAEIPDSALWMLCIDEAEYLTEEHHRILNTHIRTAAGNLVFKIATMPFAHHTLATNAEDPVREGHDFSYVYVDFTPVDSRGSQDDAAFLKFAREVFQRRLNAQVDGKASVSLYQLLGDSPLIDEKLKDDVDEIKHFMLLLSKYANEATLARATRLMHVEKKFRDEILRKMRGALLLREALQNRIGNAKLRVYCGESMIVRCSDGNARRLMRILNALLRAATQMADGSSMALPLPPRIQNEVLETIAWDTLNRTQSEPPNGRLTYKYLVAIGEYMRRIFTARRLGSDFVSSIRVSLDDGPQMQAFVKQAVQLSLLTPSRENSRNGPNESCEGVFHLAFIFSPIFGLLPRRNKAQRLPKILSESSVSTSGPQQASLEI